MQGRTKGVKKVGRTMSREEGFMKRMYEGVIVRSPRKVIEAEGQKNPREEDRYEEKEERTMSEDGEGKMTKKRERRKEEIYQYIKDTDSRTRGIQRVNDERGYEGTIRKEAVNKTNRGSREGVGKTSKKLGS